MESTINNNNSAASHPEDILATQLFQEPREAVLISFSIADH